MPRAKSIRCIFVWPLSIERRDRLKSEEHTSELQSHHDLVCRLLLEKKKKIIKELIHWINERTMCTGKPRTFSNSSIGYDTATNTTVTEPKVHYVTHTRLRHSTTR